MQDPEIKVLTLDGKSSTWRITQNLTDRWGEINDVDRENKPLDLLEGNPDFLEHLVSQMWDEITFISRKDGKFGVLFEVEFCSKKSEAHEKDHAPQWYATLNDHADVIKAIQEGLKKLAVEFPAVDFAVPDEAEIFNGRPAAWAFVADGTLDAQQREYLGLTMLNL